MTEPGNESGDAVLVRYGRVAEVARFSLPADLAVERGHSVVVRTQRGEEVGTVLERIRLPNGEHPAEEQVLRRAGESDLALAAALRQEAQSDFGEWGRSLREWNLNLELLDLEWTLDRQKLILYVLSGRGPEAAKLALYAAARGTPVEVQPVGPEGLVPVESGSSCGSGGGGGCGCH